MIDTPTTYHLTCDCHKFVALLMKKVDLEQITITRAEIELMPKSLVIILQDVADGLELRLVDMTTQLGFACSQQGGL